MPLPLLWGGGLLLTALITHIITSDNAPSNDDVESEPPSPNPANRRQAELLLAQLCRELKIDNPGLDRLSRDPEQCSRDILEALEKQAHHNAAIEQRKLDVLARQRKALSTLSLPDQGAHHV